MEFFKGLRNLLTVVFVLIVLASCGNKNTPPNMQTPNYCSSSYVIGPEKNRENLSGVWITQPPQNDGQRVIVLEPQQSFYILEAQVTPNLKRSSSPIICVQLSYRRHLDFKNSTAWVAVTMIPIGENKYQAKIPIAKWVTNGLYEVTFNAENHNKDVAHALQGSHIIVPV